MTEEIQEIFLEVRNMLYIDSYGNPVKKNRIDYPYSYDMYIVQGQPNLPEGSINGSAYSDRLIQWDYKKYNKVCEEVFGNQGQMWDNRSFEDIERFLQKYTAKENLKLIRVQEGCNQSNGYPLWLFEWFE